MRNVIVYDDFYKNPEEIRDWALQSKTSLSEGQTYPGLMTEALIPPELPNLMRSIVGSNIYYRNNEKIGWFGEFRISKFQDEFEQWIHSDPTAPWAGIVFMNPNPPEGYGTAFWKHKETGTYKMPMKHCRSFPEYDDTLIQDQLGLKNWDEVRQKIVYGDGLDESKWELDIFIPGKYNRLIVFNPQLWHSHMPKENFGSNKEEARLVQLFFFGSKP